MTDRNTTRPTYNRMLAHPPEPWRPAKTPGQVKPRVRMGLGLLGNVARRRRHRRLNGGRS
jgi:hypothetical protein